MKFSERNHVSIVGIRRVSNIDFGGFCRFNGYNYDSVFGVGIKL